MSGAQEGNNFAEVISRHSLLLILVLILCLPSIPCEESSSYQQEEPKKSWSSRVVTTRQGLARGFVFVPRGFEGVEIFLGLAYAAPPVGSLRLMPPVSGAPWQGTKMNEQPGPVCPQVFPIPFPKRVITRNSKNTKVVEGDEENEQEDGADGGESEHVANGGVEGLNETELLKTMPRGKLTQLKRLAPFLRNQSEDCLLLNVYVPLAVAEGKVDRPVPVMVFIHADDSSYGAGHPYDPSLFVSLGNIIVINFNFRLGILGFLNANSDGYFKSPANFALLDQIAALHWVQENIGAFGGDRTNVTLLGHGRHGAMYVNFLMISNALPSSELLFHRVILMSGSALSPFTVGLSYGKDLAKKFAGRFKCPIEPPSNMLLCLRQLPLQYFLDSDLWNSFGCSEDGVVIDSAIRENVLRDRISRFPMIFGVTKAESLPTFGDYDSTYGLEDIKRREVLKSFIDGFYSSGYRSEILAAAIHEYTDWERPVQHPISVRDETLDALTDAQIVAPMVKVGELHSQGSSRTYFYVFEYQSKVSDFVQRLGCVPGEDLGYILGVPLYLSGANANGAIEHSDWEEGSKSGGATITSLESSEGIGVFTGNFTRNEVQLSTLLLGYWANFIKTGNPNVEQSSSSTLHPEGSIPIGFGVSSNGGENRFSHHDKPSSAMSVKPKLIEWPSYDSLFKKYMSIEAKPRIRNHYRAHKISFWLTLVPDLQRNSGGISMFQNRLEGYPNIINSSNSTAQHPPSIQLVGPPPYWEQHPFYYSSNYSSYPGGDISVPLGSRPHHRYPEHERERIGGEGFQIYSTALAVTIAVGCSFLILNILVFAGFYYWRDKRRTARHSSEALQHSAPSNQGPISVSGGEDPSMQLSGMGPDTKRNQLTYSAVDTSMVLPSIHTTPVRLKENGQLANLNNQQMGQMLPMPNICGDLPLSNLQQLLDSSRGGNPQPPQHYQQQYQQQQHPHSHANPNPNTFPGGGGHQNSTLPSNKRQGQRSGGSGGLQNFELSMPDAILAAAMMLNYNNSRSDVRSQGSDFFLGGTAHKSSSSSGKRAPTPLNMKEQLLLSAGISAATPTSANSGPYNTGNRTGVVVPSNLGGRSLSLESEQDLSSSVMQFDFDNSKSVPRPPKRHIPTVKFSPDTFISPSDDGGACNANVNNSASLNTTCIPIMTSNATPTSTSSLNSSSSATSSSNAPSQLKSSLKKHSSYKDENLNV